MAILIDTNILLRSLQPHHPHCAIVERAVSAIRTRNETLNVTPQNLIEIWAVATRPASENGLGMAVEMATSELSLLQFFPSQLGGHNLKLAPSLPEFLGLTSTVRKAIIVESAEDRGAKINAQLHGMPTGLA